MGKQFTDASYGDLTAYSASFTMFGYDLAEGAAADQGKRLALDDLDTILSATTKTLTNKTLTTPTIASFVNANHTHTDAASGGVISSLGYTLIFGFAGGSPADATNYYFGSPIAAPLTATAQVRKRYVPIAGTITRADVTVFNNGGTVGSAETSTIYIRLNNGASETTITSSLACNAASGSANFYNVTGLSLAVAAGNDIEIKWTSPTFATNPTQVWIEVVLYVA